MLILTWPATSPLYVTIYLFSPSFFYFFFISLDVQHAVSFCSQEGFSARWVPQKKLSWWSLRAICYSVIKLGTTYVPLFHLSSAFRMQKGGTFSVQRESWCKREQNMSDTSKDVICLKSYCSELTRIPIGCPYFTFHWETVSASPREAQTLSLICAFSESVYQSFKKTNS